MDPHAEENFSLGITVVNTNIAWKIILYGIIPPIVAAPNFGSDMTNYLTKAPKPDIMATHSKLPPTPKYVGSF